MCVCVCVCVCLCECARTFCLPTCSIYTDKELLLVVCVVLSLTYFWWMSELTQLIETDQCLNWLLLAFMHNCDFVPPSTKKLPISFFSSTRQTFDCKGPILRKTNFLWSGLTHKLVLPEPANSQNEDSKQFLHGLCSPPTGQMALL